MYTSNFDTMREKLQSKIEEKKIEAQEELSMIEKAAQIIPENLHGDDDILIMKGIIRKDKISLTVKLDSLQKVAIWLISLPATEKTQEIRYAGKENQIIDSPYLIELKNPIKPNRFNNYSVRISFIHRELNITLDFPAELISDCLISGSRKITSSEYHYFAGEIGKRRLDEMGFRTNEFRSESARFYGGVRKAISPDEIDSIIEYIKG